MEYSIKAIIGNCHLIEVTLDSHFPGKSILMTESAQDCITLNMCSRDIIAIISLLLDRYIHSDREKFKSCDDASTHVLTILCYHWNRKEFFRGLFGHCVHSNVSEELLAARQA